MALTNLTKTLARLASGGRTILPKVITDIDNSIPRIIDDIIKSSGKSFDDILKADLKTLVKNNQNYRTIFADSVDEASRLQYNKTFAELINDPKSKPDAEILIRQINDDLTKDIAATIQKNAKDAKAGIKQASKELKDLRATKKATKIEIENLKKILQQNKEAAKVISEFRKQFKGFPTKTTDDIIKLFDDIKAEQATPNINPNTTVNVGTGNGGVFSGTWDKIRQTKPITYIIDKPVKSALYGLGVVGVGAAIYYMLDSKSGGQPYIALDENGNPIDPTEGSQLFPICVQELINSGEGQITKSSDGSSSVYYKEQNIYFYTNGRAYDATNKKNGTYKCRGTQFNENKSKKLSLYEIAISESSEIDLNTMTNYVDTAVDDLDGYVNVGNLNSLYSIVSALKGKTFQGKDALQQFMMLYSQEEGGDDFKDDVNSVGVRVLGTKGIVLKNQILDILSGGSGSSTTSTGEKIGLKNIDIFWDDKKIEGGGGGGGGTQPKYFDCSQKDFPYEYGCIAPKIAEIQTCKGITPNKGYFGPKTKRALGYPVITKELYDNIMAECGKGSTTNYDAIKQAVFKGSDEMIKKGKENVRNTYQNTVNNLSNNLYPTSEEFETIKNKLENYRELSDREKQIYNKYSEKFSGYPSAI